MMYLAQEHRPLGGQRRSLAHALLEHLVEPAQGVASFSLGSNVHTRTDEAHETIAAIETRGPLIKNPTVLSVVTAQAIFHREGTASHEGVEVRLHAAREVLRMNALCPAVAQLLLEGPAV